MALVDRFVPEEHFDDFQTQMRSRLVVMMLMLVIGSLPLMLSQQIIRGEMVLVGVSMIVMVVFSGTCVFHKTHPNLDRSSMVLLVGGWLGVAVTTLLSGGLYSAVTPFFAILPIMALALLGARPAIAWFVVSTTSLVLLASLAEFEVFFGDPVTFLEPLPWVSNLLLMMLYALGLIWFDEELRRVQNEELQDCLLYTSDAADE